MLQKIYLALKELGRKDWGGFEDNNSSNIEREIETLGKAAKF